MVTTSALQIARRFVGVKEAAGAASNPAVLAMLRLDAKWVEDDQTAWCSAFVNYVCWLLELPRSRSLAARSWLTVAQSVPLAEARPGFDVVVLTRGAGTQPPASVIAAPGHVGFFVGFEAGGAVLILGGNQGDAVNVAPFPRARVLGVRRLQGA